MIGKIIILLMLISGIALATNTLNQEQPTQCTHQTIPILLNQNQLFFINNTYNQQNQIINTQINQKPKIGTSDCQW
jgi:hypothetical protein